MRPHAFKFSLDITFKLGNIFGVSRDDKCLRYKRCPESTKIVTQMRRAYIIKNIKFVPFWRGEALTTICIYKQQIG